MEMNDKLIFYFSDVIHTKRKEKKLTLDDLAKLTFTDKSYLSKIENKIVKPSFELLDSILNKLSVNLIYKDVELDELNKLISNFYYDMVFLNDIQENRIKNIFDNEEKFLSSMIVDKYLIIKYMYLVIMKGNDSIINEIENILENYFVKQNLLNPFELQVYFDYKATYLKNNQKLQESIALYEKSKSLGRYKYSFGMVCYHLAVAYNKCNNYLEAYNNAKLSLSVFLEEFNIERQTYSQIHIANIYSTAKLYDGANEIYSDLLKCPIDKSTKYLIKSNLAWNLIKQSKFDIAIEVLLEMQRDMEVKLKWFYFLSWCYYKQNANEKSMSIIRESHLKNDDDLISRCKINVIELLILEGKNKGRTKKIKSIYDENRGEMDREDQIFFLSVLIEENNDQFLYKESNMLYEELCKLIS